MGRGLDGYLISVHWRCVVFRARERRSLPVSGGYSEGETPLPIPNRAVKPLSADGSWLARAWESRSPPVFLLRSTSVESEQAMRDIRTFLRQNPQVLVLLIVCLVLGLGTFLAVLFGLITSSPGNNSGEPSGAIAVINAALGALG